MTWQVSKRDPSGRLEEWVDEPVRPGGRKAAIQSLTPPSLTKTPQAWDGGRWVTQDPRSPLPLGGTGDHVSFDAAGVTEPDDRDPLDDTIRERERARSRARTRLPERGA